MLSISRALMSRPTLLLLDEPSLGLAPQVTQTIFRILREVNAMGMSILLVEQNAHLALSWPTGATCSRPARWPSKAPGRRCWPVKTFAGRT
jgi:ABC-type branched-subunit amino acid transport system ATPase component